MKYVSVTSPGSEMSRPIFNYFDDYLISLGEPITSKSWKAERVRKHVNNIINESKKEKYSLYIDSGGFQIIVGYVDADRIEDFIKVYHSVLEKHRGDIHRIFALDVYSDSFMKEFVTIRPEIPHLVNGKESTIMNSKEKDAVVVPKFPTVYVKEDLIEFYEANHLSMSSSIELIKKYPEIADKQLFILQSSNTVTFNIWKDLFDDLEVYKYHKLWSIGGLVGLKKLTNAKFSHAVPATLWLLTQRKKHNFTIDQVHWLGQSSRLSFLSMALFESLYNINMTSDSSQLVRFAPLEAKLPYIIETSENEFELVETVQEIHKMFKLHSFKDEFCYVKKMRDGTTVEMSTKFMEGKRTSIYGDVNIYGFSTVEAYNNTVVPEEGAPYLYVQMTHEQYFELTGKLNNQTFIEFQSQNLSADKNFGRFIVEKIMAIGLDNIVEETQLRDLHPIMNRDRTAKELMNNIDYFKQFSPIVESGDIDSANVIMTNIVNSYADRLASRTIETTKIKPVTHQEDEDIEVEQGCEMSSDELISHTPEVNHPGL